MNTIVYVDGFNLYYGAVKDTPYKWLNLHTLCQLLLPQHRLLKIKYYTAKVSARPNDPGQPVRQQVYLRALETIPNLEIIYGQFLQSTVQMPLANPQSNGPRFARVIKTEEKGSDVNIAAHMVHDGHLGLYDTAVIVSNDSDLVEPVKIVRHELNKKVGMLNPHKRPSYSLKQHVTFIKPIRKGVLRQSQFPTLLQDAAGSFHKPPSW
jgi:uncharacterized LabA/DUF88 family protein